MDNSKVDLVKNVLKQYIYAFKEEKIYAKQYFKEVITKIYVSEKFKENFVLFSVDCDKLGKLNEEKGRKTGSLALKNSLNILVENLPKNTTLSRLGGDEFVGIIENRDIKEVTDIINNIKKLLAEKDEKLKVQMSFGIVDSKEYKNLSDMLIATEEQISLQKNIKLDKKVLTNLDIENNIKENIIAFYDCLRIGQTNILNKAKINQYKKFITETYENIILSKDINENLLKEISVEIEDENTTNNLTFEEAFIIHKNIVSDNEIIDILKEDKKLSKDIFKKLFYKMLYNANTNQFNKLYYQTILEKKLDSEIKHQNYEIIYFHATGLKITNTLLGHKQTDKKLNDLGKDIENVFDENQNNNSKFFNKKPLQFNKKSSYFLDMGSGNFMAIMPDTVISEEKVIENMYDIYKKYNDDFLQLNYSQQNTKDFKNMKEVLTEAKLECELQRSNKFNQTSYSIVTPLLKKYLSNSIDYYQSDKERFRDEETQGFFINAFLQNFEDIYREKYVIINENHEEEK